MRGIDCLATEQGQLVSRKKENQTRTLTMAGEHGLQIIPRGHLGGSYGNRRGSPLKKMTSMRTAIIPAKNMNADMVLDSRNWVPERRSAIQPTRNVQPCQFVGGPQPEPDGFAGNQ